MPRVPSTSVSSKASATEVWPGVLRLNTPFNKEFNTWVKEGDGSYKRYHFDFKRQLATKKAWYIPIERLDGFRQACLDLGWGEPSIEHLPPSLSMGPVAGDEPLTTWQSNAVERVLRDRVRLAQWITGAGKSRLAIEVYNQLLAASSGVPIKAVIVCPKMMLKTWEEQQLPKWLVPCESVSVWALTAGRKLMLKEGRGENAVEVLRRQPETLLVSWDSLHRIPDEWRFDLIVYDELHAGIEGRSKRSGAARLLSARNGRAIRIGLTATPVSTSLTDLHSQLDILCPHRWGSYPSWWRSYFVELPAYEEHTKPGPLRDDRREAFVQALEMVADYVSHEDVGDALPPVSWHELVIGKGGGASHVGPPESLTAWREEQMATATKRAEAFASAYAELPQTDKPTAFICYHRSVGARLASLFPGAAYIDGSITVKDRYALLAEAPLAIATMKSIAEGLDLRRYTRVFVVEAYPVPRYLTQVLGRFIRLYATDAVDVTFCRLHGSSDDIVINKLLQRMSDHSTVVKQGKVESGLGALLSIDESSEDFLAELRAAAASFADDDFEEDWESEDEWE